jgi:hypothetical protein
MEPAQQLEHREGVVQGRQEGPRGEHVHGALPVVCDWLLDRFQGGEGPGGLPVVLSLPSAICLKLVAVCHVTSPPTQAEPSPTRSRATP